MMSRIVTNCCILQIDSTIKHLGTYNISEFTKSKDSEITPCTSHIEYHEDMLSPMVSNVLILLVSLFSILVLISIVCFMQNCSQALSLSCTIKILIYISITLLSTLALYNVVYRISNIIDISMLPQEEPRVSSPMAPNGYGDLPDGPEAMVEYIIDVSS